MTNNSIFETKHFYVFRLLIHFARSRTLWLSSFYTIKFVSYLLMTKLNAFHCQSTKCHDSDLIRIIVLGLTIQFEWLWMHGFDFHKSIDFQDIWILFVFLCSTISCVWFITEGERIGLSSPFSLHGFKITSEYHRKWTQSIDEQFFLQKKLHPKVKSGRNTQNSRWIQIVQCIHFHINK